MSRFREEAAENVHKGGNCGALTGSSQFELEVLVAAISDPIVSDELDVKVSLLVVSNKRPSQFVFYSLTLNGLSTLLVFQSQGVCCSLAIDSSPTLLVPQSSLTNQRPLAFSQFGCFE